VANRYQSRRQHEARLKGDAATCGTAGQVASDQTLNIPRYAGNPGLIPRCFWKVPRLGKDGKPSVYSEPACWEMGPALTAGLGRQWSADRPISIRPRPHAPPRLQPRQKHQTGPGLLSADWGYYELQSTGRRSATTASDPPILLR